MFHPRFPSPSPALLALALALCAGSSADDQEDAITTAPIYLPYYNEESWSLVRGSVIASNPEEQQTTYTIFCLNENPPACDISLEFPFELVEGPDRVKFHGTYTSTYIANLECALDGTTAATCSGYSSYKAGYMNGLHTGPTEVSWTSTYSGSEVEWGVLTMAEVPVETDDQYDITATAQMTPATGSGYVNIPLSTVDEGFSTSLRANRRLVVVGGLGSAILVGFLF
ncbi:hypothetical protein AK830_g6760 [Neonectria ditissima]|uniref:Uncharacterized protein n=1 Tax=Neonectria ditissima TaxID=78410 RepID=A0A0P7BHR2_9HYPO|nr:hypothetical protein AK830_g6760 [Neonectria ditissima]